MFGRVNEATGKVKAFKSRTVTVPIGNTARAFTEPDKIA
jgi:hypothetical protein